MVRESLPERPVVDIATKRTDTSRSPTFHTSLAESPSPPLTNQPSMSSLRETNLPWTNLNDNPNQWSTVTHRLRLTNTSDK